MRKIVNLVCRASLDAYAQELAEARARARSDESWAEWVREYDAGEALVLALEVTARIDGDGGGDSIKVRNHGVWVETDTHPPLVAGQVQQAVQKDFNALAAELRERGVYDVTARDLAGMYVEVELADDVLAALADRRATPRRLQPQTGDGCSA